MMRKQLGTMAFALAAILTTLSARADEWFVNASKGNDANDGRSAAAPKLTIRAATTNAVANDVIYVAAGTYGAAEGSQVVTAGDPAFRVVVPADVSLVATNAEKTIILGAASTDESADAYGNGPGAIRCAWLGANAKISGFTLTGGRTLTSSCSGGAAFGASGTTSVLEDCIVSNNVSACGNLYQTRNVRCRILGNRATTGSGGSAGSSCGYVGCVIDKNYGDIVTYKAVTVDSCTFGSVNRNGAGNGKPQLCWWYKTTYPVYNSIFLYGKWYGTPCLTNCLMITSVATDTVKANWGNCLTISEAADAKLNADYSLQADSPAIDKGDQTLSSDPNGVDLYGHPRVMNGQIDIGASEYGRYWYVDQANGDDANDGLTAAKAKKTICAATVDAAKPDIIYVAEGTYGADEGARQHADNAKTLTRVILPSGVDLIATGRREKTLIVGAAGAEATADLLGNGPGAVRCVVASGGSLIKGFTITGGHTFTNNTGVASDTEGGAIRTGSSLNVTVEDCVISNNASRYVVILNADLKRCRIVGNFSGDGTGTTGTGAAGQYCRYTGCVIAQNRGAATVCHSVRIDSCTFGSNLQHDGTTAQALFAKPSVVCNSIFRNGMRKWGTVCATNCYYTDTIASTVFPDETCSNCFAVPQSSLAVDADWRPIIGRNVAIDKADAAYVPDDIGVTDLTGAQRIMNGAMDVGAVEADWRSVYAAALGKRVTVETVSAEVATNATGGVAIPSGAISGYLTRKGTAVASFEITGNGTLSAYLDGQLVGAYTAGSTQATLGDILPGATFRFVYTPGEDDTGSAILRSLKSMNGALLFVRQNQRGRFW